MVMSMIRSLCNSFMCVTEQKPRVFTHNGNFWFWWTFHNLTKIIFLLSFQSCTAAGFRTTPAGSVLLISQRAGFPPAAAPAPPTAARPIWGTPLWLLAKSTDRWGEASPVMCVRHAWNKEELRSVTVASAGLLWAGDSLHREQHGDHCWGDLWHRLLSGIPAAYEKPLLSHLHIRWPACSWTALWRRAGCLKKRWWRIVWLACLAQAWFHCLLSQLIGTSLACCLSRLINANQYEMVWQVGTHACT